jgi:hypothetical protein
MGNAVNEIVIERSAERTPTARFDQARGDEPSRCLECFGTAHAEHFGEASILKPFLTLPIERHEW